MPHSKDAVAAPRWRELLRTRAVLTLLVVELLVAGLVAYGLWALRQQTLDGELRMLASLAAATAAQADSTLDVADAALRATRAELSGGLLQPGTAAADAFLRSRAAALPRFRALALVDSEGRRVSTSREDALRPVSLAQRDFFLATRDGTPAQLFVGSPYKSEADGRDSIGVAMDWRGADGAFRGVIALVAEPEFLDGDFEHIAPTRDTGMAIYRRDRELVSDGPGDGTGRLLPAAALQQLWAVSADSAPRLLTLADGTQRLVAAHLLHRFPLLVVVTRDARTALADWSEQAGLVAAFAASALLVTFVLTLRNLREQGLRRAADAALEREQARAVRAFQAAQEGHWEWNPATRQSHLSPRMKELLGIARDDPLHGPGDLIERGAVHPDDVAPLRAAAQAHREGRSAGFDVTFRVRQLDGRWHQVRARGQLWRDASGQPALFSGTAADVTEELDALQHKRELEDQLQRARKLEALGTLAGGVSHDFNSILAAVIGYGELAREQAPEGSKQARQLDQVLQAGQRGKALVERVLSFSRGTPRARTVFRLEPLVDEVLQLLAGSLPAGTRLDRQLQAPAALIRGDATMVYEAAMNLCTNGLQAMPDGGRLTVELAEVDLDQPLALFERSLPPGPYVRLAVADSGAGIAPEVMGRLFEPFFTTKGPQQGTGLGLAVVHGVMADLGGAIDVQSRPGQGARFSLYFPRVAGEAAAEPASGGEALPQGRGQTLMVVDDDAALVELAEELLAGLGYEPVGFSAPALALAAFRAEPDRFDLLLSDEVMPGLSGTALVAAVHAIRPALPVVLASGFGGPLLEQRAAEAGVTLLVRKPLARAELARAIAQALQTVPPGAAA